MVGNAKLRPNHGGDPAARPERPPEPVGLGAAVQEGRQAGQLLGGQAPGSTRGKTMPECLGTTHPGSFHPLADGSFADTQCLGDSALRPAPLLELPGLQPPGFFPILGCRVHA
jgi:hypothetical protein